MAPSAISSSEDGNNHVDTPSESSSTNGTNSEVDGNGGKEGHTYGPTELYTDAYTHGYTEGYIAGYGLPAQMPIAIVGMSCRLPGNVSTPDEFWELLSRARTGWSEIPKERFDSASFYHPTPGKSGCCNAIGGNFLTEDLGLFDAPFFSLTSQEATSMDPQQRILLECTFEALESAGIPKHEIVGKDMGVFIGGTFSEYESQLFADTDSTPMYQATGCHFAMQSNRLSHFFDLRGPSLTMDTACSSSLVALHQACQSLRNKESKSAIVGGCHLNMLPENWISMSKSRLFSDQGRSFSFDSRGTGYGRGEGCGIVILKPLDQALKDNDTIRSVIVASGINQDGKTPGITMPNGSAQESLMRSVYKNAGIDPKDTGYVEAHGTGTKVGDPIEAAALHSIFGEDRSARNPLFIGSVKSNIGHLEAASGIISVIKTAMMLERGFILPNYDFKKPNEKIPFSKWHLKVPISQRPWPRPKRFASVNNFGFGGTNAHVVLERAPFLPEPETKTPETSLQPRKLFILSANDKNALEALMKNIGIYLEQRPEIFQNDLMSNVAYTLGQRRSLMQWRVAIPSASSFDLIQALNSGKIAPIRETEPLRVGFIFTGQGAQCARMGWELYEQYPVFASTMNECDKYLQSLDAPFSLLAELQKDEKDSLVNEAQISQPACTAIQLALTDLLRSWGISPVAVTGHSSGEIGAAYAAGILSLPASMAISYYRGIATISLKKNFPNLRGAMMAVGCTKEEIAPIICQLTTPKDVRIACYNSPTSLTISGDEPAIHELQELLEREQIFNRKLQVDVAYHSHHMKLVADEYFEAIKALDTPRPSSARFHSSLFGQLVGASRLEASYWVKNLTQSVRFSESLMNMCEPIDEFKTGVNMLIEIGPHSALAGPVKQILKASGANAMKIPYTSALVRKKDAVETALDLASVLFVRGGSLSLGAINLPQLGKQPSLLVDMPRYPWNHQNKYWHEPRLMQKHKNRTAPRHDLLGTLANYSNDLEPTWRNTLRLAEVPWLRYHKIQSLTLFPMSGFLAMALEAASQKASARHLEYEKFELRDVSVSSPLIITDDDVEMTLQLRPHQDSSSGSSEIWDEFKIHSWASKKGWTEHCTGHIATKLQDDAMHSLKSKMANISCSASQSIGKTEIYDSLSGLGVSYGVSFQGLENCRASDECSIANITVTNTAREMPQEFETGSVIHPAFLEQLIEMYWPILGAGRKSIETIYLPSAIRHITVSRAVTELTKSPGASLRAFCKGSIPSPYPRATQISAFATADDSSKEALISLDGLTISPILEREMSSQNEIHRELCYKLTWEPRLDSVDAGKRHTVTSNGMTNGISKSLSGAVNGVSKFMTSGVSTIFNGASDFPRGDIIIIIHTESEAQRHLASNLADAIENATNMRPSTGDFLSAEVSSKICLFLTELDAPLLSKLTSTQFIALQKLLATVQGVLWVVRGAYLGSSIPEANMITGLSRSVRSETLLKFATLDLDSKCELSQEHSVDIILEVFKATFAPTVEDNCELEFSERGGKLFTPRIVEDVEMNEYVHKQIKSSSIEPTPFVQENRPLKMIIGMPGALDTLHFVDEVYENPLAENEIEIEVRAIGVNSQDLAAAMGQLDYYDIGAECSGIVTKVGPMVSTFAIGDRIAGVSVRGGVYSTHARLMGSFAIKIGSTLSFEEAASMPIAFCAANFGLVSLAQLEKGERVLVYGADSATGHAVVNLCQVLGAEVFAIVTIRESRELLSKDYGIHHDHILQSSAEAYRQGDFDIILNCVHTNTDTSQDLWNSLNNFGRFVEMFKSSRPNLDLNENKCFMSVDIFALASQKPQAMMKLVSLVSELLQTGAIKPTSSITVLPISDVENAFRIIQNGHADGKLVVSPQPGNEVKATPSAKQKSILRPDATYILIGGTGGLGRSMARWMVGRGARNLVLVSRSGSVTGKVKELVDDLSPTGANILVKQCDVSSLSHVQQLLIHDLSSLPPVRGVIHGAMVLDDVLFEKMTYDQYDSVIASKLHGASNFHTTLLNRPTPLDFFITLSSVAGAVGNRGQAAYSAANTYLNALIQHRHTLSLPGTSIDLTAVSDSGYLAENAAAAAEVSRNLGSETICEAEVLALLSAAITGIASRTCNDHIITGLRLDTPLPFWANDAKFSTLLKAHLDTTNSNTPQQISYHSLLLSSKNEDEAVDVVCKGLLDKLPEVLMLEKGDMDVSRSLGHYALDSLVAIEVRNWITREFEVNLQVLELLSSGSIEALARGIVGRSGLCGWREKA